MDDIWMIIISVLKLLLANHQQVVINQRAEILIRSS